MTDKSNNTHVQSLIFRRIVANYKTQAILKYLFCNQKRYEYGPYQTTTSAYKSRLNWCRIAGRTRGAGEVHLWALKGTRYFSFWHGWDTVGTRLGHGDIGAIGAQEVHERGTRGAREVHERGTRGAREGHERGTRGAREVHRLTSLRPNRIADEKCLIHQWTEFLTEQQHFTFEIVFYFKFFGISNI